MTDADFALVLPGPAPDGERVQLAHGGGGRAMEQLIDSSSARFRQPRAGRAPRRRASRPRGAARLHHRFLRRPAAVLSRRRHRHAGGQRHGQRPRHVRRAAALSERRLHPRGGLPMETLAPGRRVDARGGGRGRRPHRHRRHQGGGPRQGRRAVRQHRRRRARSWRSAADRAASVRPGDAVLLSGDIGRHGMAIMAVREGSNSRPRSRATARRWRSRSLGAARGRHRGALPARPDARRAGQRPGRDRRDGRPAPSIDEARSRCARMSGRPARSSASIRSTSPTRAASSPSSPADRRRAGARASSAAITCQRRGDASSARSARRPPGRVTSREPIGGTRVIDMLSGEQLPRIC